MKGIKKFYQYNMDLFLPLAAVLLGILIMALAKPISIQAYMAVPMPQAFTGEYSYDADTWHPLESSEALSAEHPDLYLRGHFVNPIPEHSRLYFFSDHIGSSLSINGELLEQDIILEIQQYGIDLQPSMCCREWKFHYIAQEVPEHALVEIHIRNPHSFGNKNAYQYFLETLCCTPNDQQILSKNLVSSSQPYNVAGIILVIVGMLLLCSALVCLFLRVPLESTVIQTGLLAAASGGYFLLDTVDLAFRSESHILNSYGWQICLMYSVYLLGTMARDQLSGKRRAAAAGVMAVSGIVNMILILLSFSGAVVIYDTLYPWMILQWGICLMFIGFCGWELFAEKQSNTVYMTVSLVIFLCILLDSLGFMDSIYSRNSLTKAAVILLLVLKLIHYAHSIIVSFRTSSKTLKLEKELEESRIALMISQIQPHFIFNVLGTIRGLCRENPEQAWHGLGDFSTYLRANMNALTNEKSIPFEKELAHVQTYIRLEQMRMGEKLNVVYDIREKDFSIPTLMLQPLVENAVKHGLFYKAEGGTILIRSEMSGGNVKLSVIDDGIGFAAAAAEGDYDQREHHGLANVRSRVEKMLGGTLHIESNAGQGSTVTLEFSVDPHL